MTRSRKNLWFGLACAAACCGASIWFFAAWVPFDFDEFVAYRPISCLYYPLNRLNLFRLPCGSLDLSILDSPFLPLRSFNYVGSLQALFYYPLFLLWKSPHSARLLGAVLLCAQALLLRRSFGTLPFIFVLTGLFLFMPYSFQHVVDTGQLSLQLTSVFALWLILSRWRAAIDVGTSTRLRYAAAYGTILFLGVWARLSYLFIVPALVLQVAILLGLPALLNRSHRRERLISLSRDVVCLSACFLVPTLLLLFATDRWGHTYISVILSSLTESSFSSNSVVEKITTKALPYLLTPAMAAHHIFAYRSKPYSVPGFMMWLAILALATFSIRHALGRNVAALRAVGLYALFVITVVLIAASHRSWAMHHFVLAYPFLILAVFHTITIPRSRHLQLAVWVGVAILGVSSYLQLTTDRVFMQATRGFSLHMVELNQYVNRFADSHLFVVDGYGFSHLKALYGPTQQGVIYTHRLRSEDEVRSTLEVIHAQGRKALFIVNQGKQGNQGSQIKRIKSAVPGLQELQPPFDTYPWILIAE